MRTISKIVLVIVLITLVYSLVKLISAATIKSNTFSLGTWNIRQNQNNNNNNNNIASEPVKEEQNIPSSPDTPNAQGLYQADEILIDGQGKAGQNYIDITSDTPITPQPQNTEVQNANTQSSGSAQNNNYNDNNGGAYAQASVTIDNNNNASTSSQGYAPGMPAFEVFDGN